MADALPEQLPVAMETLEVLHGSFKLRRAGQQWDGVRARGFVLSHAVYPAVVQPEADPTSFAGEVKSDRLGFLKLRQCRNYKRSNKLPSRVRD